MEMSYVGNVKLNHKAKLNPIPLMDKQTGQLINSFDFCLLITDVYCGHLTNERA